jgi:hypothetical protein
MKKSLSKLVSWLSNWREQPAQVEPRRSSSMPEHERRLRDLQEKGRMLFLP